MSKLEKNKSDPCTKKNKEKLGIFSRSIEEKFLVAFFWSGHVDKVDGCMSYAGEPPEKVSYPGGLVNTADLGSHYEMPKLTPIILSKGYI